MHSIPLNTDCERNNNYSPTDNTLSANIAAGGDSVSGSTGSSGSMKLSKLRYIEYSHWACMENVVDSVNDNIGYKNNFNSYSSNRNIEVENNIYSNNNKASRSNFDTGVSATSASSSGQHHNYIERDNRIKMGVEYDSPSSISSNIASFSFFNSYLLTSKDSVYDNFSYTMLLCLVSLAAMLVKNYEIHNLL